MDVATAKLLVEAVKGRDISLCGIQPDQTSADYRAKRLESGDAVLLASGDAVLLASDLSKAGVSASLKKVR